MLGSQSVLRRSKKHVTDPPIRVVDPAQPVAASVEDISRAIPLAPVRGVLADINLTGALDVSSNCGGQILTSGGPLADPAVISIDWESRTAWVAAGATLAAISDDLLNAGWSLENLGGPSRITAAGALSLGISGPFGTRSGSIDALPNKIQFVDGRGERRQVVKKGTDVSNLLAVVGALGLTGIPTAAQVAIRPVSSGWMLVDSRRCETFEAVCQALEAPSPESYAYARIDPTGFGSQAGRGTVVVGRHAKVLELPAIRRPDALTYVAHAPNKAVATLPLKVGSHSGARAVQGLAHRTTAPLRRDQLVPLASFFHSTADARIESKRATGSLTYEFAVPTHKADVIGEFLSRLAQLGGVGDHATLQRCVRSVSGPLSMTVTGWLFSIELASDVPGLGRMLDEWDERVCAVGGQVLLATDARIRPEMLAAMYPGLSRWEGLRDELDPGRHFCSDLSRRLKL